MRLIGPKSGQLGPINHCLLEESQWENELSFFYNGVVAYSALPLDLRTEDDYNSFCKKLDRLLGI